MTAPRRVAAGIAGAVLLTVGALSSRAAELIMFDRADCPWCRQFDREIALGYKRTDEGRRAPLRRIDISRQKEAGVTLKSPVTLTPTFVLSEDGVEVGRLSGYAGAEFFYPLLDEQLAKLPKTDGRAPR